MSTYTTENSARYEIMEFLKVFKTKGVDLNTDHLTLINGGFVNGVKIDGFITMKNKVLNLLKEPADNSSIALNFIISQQNNLK